jgi:phage gpG-like protein
MFDLALKGASELMASLDALPDTLRAALTEKVQNQAQALYSQVVDVNLDGGVLNSRSGALRDSMQLEVQPQDALIAATIYANGAAPYAAILEFGGKTSAHEILPDKAKALAFVVNGKQFFARRVQHPGSTFAARSYLGSALDEQSDDIAQGLQDVVVATAENLKGSS